jgi:small subunit ribosomal protein S21
LLRFVRRGEKKSFCLTLWLCYQTLLLIAVKAFGRWLLYLLQMTPDKLFFIPIRRGLFVQVLVRDNNVDQALRVLKKKLQREGVFREMKLRRNYEKPSEKRVREQAEAVRRARKVERKRKEREGM